MALITVDTHTDAWVAALRAGFDLILLDPDGLATVVDASMLQDVSTLHFVRTILTAVITTHDQQSHLYLVSPSA